MIRKLAERQWSTESIAAFFGVGQALINRRFRKELDEGRHIGKSKLIDKMWERIDEKSDRILEHAMNRFIGPIASHVMVDQQVNDISDKTDEDEKKELLRLRAIHDVS